MIVSDNGTEFTSNAILRWCSERRIEWQRMVARNLKFEHTPVLHFEFDDRLAAGDRVLQILNEAKESDEPQP